MKVFYSELAANPAYYAFGYSVYGILEEGEALEDIYQKGFMPFVGTRDQPPRMLYMARGTRVRVQEFKETHYHTYARTKFAPYDTGITVTTFERAEYPDQKFLEDFLFSYFCFRFGKGSVPRERLTAILASPLLTHVIEYRMSGEVIGVSLETQGEGFTHLWYYAYVKTHEKHCLGLRICLDIMERTKAAGRTYLYFGSTYGSWMKYKTYFQPLEYWDGGEWRNDPKSKMLKKLLAGDPSRMVALSDPWRDEHHAYLKPPVPYTSIRSGTRFLLLVLYGTPQIFKIILMLVSLLWVLFLFQIFFS